MPSEPIPQKTRATIFCREHINKGLSFDQVRQAFDSANETYLSRFQGDIKKFTSIYKLAEFNHIFIVDDGQGNILVKDRCNEIEHRHYPYTSPETRAAQDRKALKYAEKYAQKFCLEYRKMCKRS